MKAIKLKIVNKGHVATMYQWERVFLCFGYWTPFYNRASTRTEPIEYFVNSFDYLSKLR